MPVSDIEFFTISLKRRFVILYEEYATHSTAFGRYLQSQLKWHHYCSYFLVDYNHDLSVIGLHPSDPVAVDVVSIRSQWHHLSITLLKERAKVFLMLYCSSMYDELLCKCHSVIDTSSQPDAEASCSVINSDDIYYQVCCIVGILASKFVS